MIKKIALAIVALILCLMAAVFLFAKDIEVTVSENEAQTSINDFLKSESQEPRGIRITPKYVSIDFKADNTAEIKSNLDIEGFGYAGEFDGKFASGINYRRPRLYLDDLSIIDGGFNTDDETQSELNDLKKVAVDILRRQRANASGKSDNKNTEIVEDFVVSSTKSFFERVPIYDITKAGNAGLAASLALKDVRFTADTAIITLSPVTALLRILGILGTIALAILWVFKSVIIHWLLSRSNDSESSQNQR